MTIQWGKIFYMDCMDSVRGLPYIRKLIEDGKIEKIDYCFTDPPFNIKFGKGCLKMKVRNYKPYTMEDKHILYSDNMTPEEYARWCAIWFAELKAICNVVLIYCGERNEYMWVDIEKPYGKINVRRVNPNTGNQIAHLNIINPILVYGKPKNLLKMNCIDYLSLWGFLSPHRFNHPCPLNEQLILDLFTQYKPESVIDPFMGSGATAETCEILGIKWFGYESNQAYEPDVNWRLKRAKRRAKIIQKQLNQKQATLTSFS